MKSCGLVVFAIGFSFVLVSCDSSRGSETEKPTVGEQELSGRVTYDFVPFATSSQSGFGAGLDYSASEERPVRGAQVLLLDDQGETLDRTLTDNDGEYRFSVPAQTQAQIRVLAALEREGTPGWDLTIRDNTQGNALYALDGTLRSTGDGDSRRNLHAPSGWDGEAYSESRASGPFAVLDTLYLGKQRILEYAPEQIFPPLTVFWSPDNRPAQGEIEDGDIGTSYYLDGEIYLLGDADLDTDEFDRHVVLHEWGHYLEHLLYRTDTPGGPHSRQNILDMRVALSEGFANAFAAMMLDDPLYRDSVGPGQALAGGFVLGQDGGTQPQGWYSEASVGDIFYRYYASENNQREYGIFHQTLSGPDYRQAQSLTSIYLFADQFEQNRPGGLDDFLLQENIFARGEWGAGETNSGGIEDSLPVYRELLPDGVPVIACSRADYGQYNKLLNRQYLSLSIGAAGDYRIELTAEGSPSANLGFSLFKRGELLARPAQEGASLLQRQVTLAPGEYVLEVYDWRNLNANTAGVNTCLAVRVHL
ncbi:hypothetical protein [Marinimicrobium sp. ABcell2]|uniref:hypothetical protein n=1 Tax=Marinimicrobium sp. ABcell2 TaxID=3069751 RepID=UPI0027B26949|nr:hypothetical protein [Marinimicrobium sp. ABcell2]MDQ2075653.1 hypothetical protein [Marinimicrobium sp. ABcell2]